MDKMDLNEKFEMLEKMFNMREEEIYTNDKNIKGKLNNIKLEDLQDDIEKNMNNEKMKDDIINKLDLLIENYEIKMASYVEERYKQGFKDAFDLILECIKTK